ncbi:hypothetical protein HOD29_00230 [archaeon]|jgi:hypothetical protein|nr:hypothetical protein [archaeon]
MIKFGLPEKESAYQEYIVSRRPVKIISAPNEISLGQIYKEDNEFVYLLPAVLPRALSLSGEKIVQHYILEEELPTKIRRNLVSKIEPSSWEHLGNLIENSQRVMTEEANSEMAKRNGPGLVIVKR